ncbi:signal peptidase I [Fictibacillus enclensis]|uniref:signal peptidase I n=1 Tax=Fictibacillus enclensis TaxID=1017270 RepID=UPI0024C02477|nr:signal peptidase I [Fictibacillus enclensis]MDM5336752.1 signal peptidase I [Fictibacillus enclensis]WHY73184.1 signal peptidase I [Fictibacillus enclensis]
MSSREKSSQLWDWIKAIGIALILALLIKNFLFEQYVVYGESMMPTIENGNRLIVNKLGYNIGEPKRFDLIVFHANSQEDYIKRVIGMPGEHIEYVNDHLFINGKQVDEPYLDDYKKQVTNGNLTGDFTLEEVTGKKVIPKGKVFVMGDNRLHSIDSRHIGLVDESKIVGEVNLRYWPMEELKVIK